MVIILYQQDCQEIATSIAADLRDAFSDHLDVSPLCASSRDASLPSEISWDDLLIVIYTGADFPPSGAAVIKQFVETRSQSALVLPVAANLRQKTPPAEINGIKALDYDGTAKGPKGRLANRVGGILSLRVQGRDSKIFISYRASDGEHIANQLFAHLTSLGHRPFLDQAKEIDDETKILPGTPVQMQIDDALGTSNLVLLIDTPSAPESRGGLLTRLRRPIHFCCQSFPCAFGTEVIRNRGRGSSRCWRCSAGYNWRARVLATPSH
jgi:hypothetical protein